jgi:hypothetical protein
MKAGELVCIGSSQHLKSKFGSGYRLEVKVRSGAAMKRVQEFVAQHWPSSHVLESNTAALRASWELKAAVSEAPSVAAGNGLAISQVFGLMKQNQSELEIVE